MPKYRALARTGGAVTAFSLAAALMLSGCGDKEDDQIASEPVGSAGSATPDATVPAPGTTPATPSAAPPASSAPSADPSPSDVPSDPTGDPAALTDCLPGNWYSDPEEFAALMVGNSKNLVTDVTGSMMLTLRADGSTDTYYEDWTYTFTVSSATVTIAKDGTDSGTYVVADDGGVDLTDTDLASTTDARMTISGNEVAQVVEPQPSVFSLATLACSGDELTATVGSQVATLHREH